MKPQCSVCSGTGWRYVESGGGVSPCPCRDRRIAQAMTDIQTRHISDPDVRSFVEYLKEHCRGPKRALTATKLAPCVLGSERSGGADRRLRALAHAATEAGIPVASGNSGYFLATAPEHLNEVIRRLESQAKKHFARSAKLKALQDVLGRERHGSIFDQEP